MRIQVPSSGATPCWRLIIRMDASSIVWRSLFWASHYPHRSELYRLAQPPVGVPESMWIRSRCPFSRLVFLLATHNPFVSFQIGSFEDLSFWDVYFSVMWFVLLFYVFISTLFEFVPFLCVETCHYLGFPFSDMIWFPLSFCLLFQFDSCWFHLSELSFVWFLFFGIVIFQMGPFRILYQFSNFRTCHSHDFPYSYVSMFRTYFRHVLINTSHFPDARFADSPFSDFCVVDLLSFILHVRPFS